MFSSSDQNRKKNEPQSLTNPVLHDWVTTCSFQLCLSLLPSTKWPTHSCSLDPLGRLDKIISQSTATLLHFCHYKRTNNISSLHTWNNRIPKMLHRLTKRSFHLEIKWIKNYWTTQNPTVWKINKMHFLLGVTDSCLMDFFYSLTKAKLCLWCIEIFCILLWKKKALRDSIT